MIINIFTTVLTNYYFKFRLIDHLTRIMENGENKTLIFTQTKKTADEITRYLRKDGWPALGKLLFY